MRDEPPTRSRRRHLSDEEIALWLAVTKSVTPRPDSQVPILTVPIAASSEGTAAAPAKEAPPSTLAKSAPHLPNLAPIERRLRQRLVRGRAEIDAAIDLHGLNQQQAHAALHRFLQRAQANDATLVLVVTGKGETRGNDIYGGGVLRRQVPWWLKAPEWRRFVVGFDEAARPHGGAGALYVRLRRRSQPER